MPLRVRCRCGQELVVRYSEWVYVALVLVLLAVIANTAAVLILVASLGRLASGNGPRESSGTPTPDTKSAEAKRPTRRAADGVQRDAEESPPSPGGEEEDGSETPRAIQPADDEEVDTGRSTEDLGGSASARAVQDLLEELDLLEEEPAAQTVDRETSPPRAPTTRRLVDVSPVLRLYLLDRARSDLAVSCACLADPDGLLRRRALEQVLEHEQVRTMQLDDETRRRCAPLLRGARGFLSREEAGRRLLEVFDVKAADAEAADEGPDPTAVAQKILWSQLQSRARRLLDALPMKQALESRLQEIESQGADLLIAVDTTQSMEEGLTHLQRAAPWLLASLEWTVPGSRVGLLLYKDRVEETIGFSEDPRREVLPRILALEAEGGGDVPEGVHAALRAALELSRFDWRDEARKHVVIFGDQPPRYEEKRPLESLAAASHRQAGFAIHLLGISPPDDLPAVPFFADFAEAGGGRHSTCRPETVGLEILTSLLGEEAQPALRQLVPLLRGAFAAVP